MCTLENTRDVAGVVKASLLGGCTGTQGACRPGVGARVQQPPPPASRGWGPPLVFPIAPPQRTAPGGGQRLLRGLSTGHGRGAQNREVQLTKITVMPTVLRSSAVGFSMSRREPEPGPKKQTNEVRRRRLSRGAIWVSERKQRGPGTGKLSRATDRGAGRDRTEGREQTEHSRTEPGGRGTQKKSWQVWGVIPKRGAGLARPQEAGGPAGLEDLRAENFPELHGAPSPRTSTLHQVSSGT